MLPFRLTLGAVWLFCLPACGFVISHSGLSTLSWGHAGEALFLPFLLLSPVLYFGVLHLVKKIVLPKVNPS
jgi:hypothetical protein